MRLWISKKALSESAALKTASAEELRTLLTVVAYEGEDVSIEEIAKSSDVARSRAAAAIALFTEDKIITDSKPVYEKTTITEEFEERLRRGELLEETSLDTAKTIRDEGLASLIEETARLMKRDSFSTSEVKLITGITTQYSLTPEFVLLLAAHLASTTAKLTPAKLRDEAIKLSEKEITTVEELEKYIETVSAENDIHREFRRIMGLYGGALSATQKKYFNRWGLEFGFGTAIVAEAYDRAALYADRSMQYMDTILTSWHEAGCKTVAECIAHSESTKASSENSKSEKAKTRGKKTEAVHYSDFDANEAFLRALERSYGESAKDIESEIKNV